MAIIILSWIFVELDKSTFLLRLLAFRWGQRCCSAAYYALWWEIAWVPFIQDALFGGSWASDSGEDENVKVYGQTDGRRTTGDQKFSSVELKRFMLSTNILVFKFCLTKWPALSTRTVHRVFIRLKYSYQCSLLVLALRIKRSVSSFRGWKGIGCSIITNTTGVN